MVLGVKTFNIKQRPITRQKHLKQIIQSSKNILKSENLKSHKVLNSTLIEKVGYSIPQESLNLLSKSPSGIYNFNGKQQIIPQFYICIVYKNKNF